MSRSGEVVQTERASEPPSLRDKSPGVAACELYLRQRCGARRTDPESEWQPSPAKEKIRWGERHGKYVSEPETEQTLRSQRDDVALQRGGKGGG